MRYEILEAIDRAYSRREEVLRVRMAPDAFCDLRLEAMREGVTPAMAAEPTSNRIWGVEIIVDPSEPRWSLVTAR